MGGIQYGVSLPSPKCQCFSADIDFTGLTEYNIPIWDALNSCSLNISHDYEYPFFSYTLIGIFGIQTPKTIPMAM